MGGVIEVRELLWGDCKEGEKGCEKGPCGCEVGGIILCEKNGGNPGANWCPPINDGGSIP